MNELTILSARSVMDSIRAFLLSFAVVFCWAVLACLPAVAQDDAEEEEQPAAQPAVASPAPVAKDYTVLKIDDSLKSSASKVSQSLRRGFEAGDADLFNKVCDNYILPMMTQPGNLHEIASLRQKLTGQLATARNGATRDSFNKHLLDVLPKMASGNYHPAVRYNCMLLIGELDQSPPASIRDLAVPLPDALPILLGAVADANQLEAVKVAALVGIYRHAVSLRDNAARARVSDAMLALAKTKGNEKISPKAHAWMRAMAIDTLGEMKSSGDANATAKALLEIVDDAQAPLAVRAAAAEAVGKLDYSNPGDLNADAMVRQLGRLAMAACKYEIDECKEKNRTISPRILKTQLLAVRQGLMGTKDLRVEEAQGGAMKLLKQAEEKKNADEIRKQIDRWLGELDRKELIKKLEPEQDPAAGGMVGPGMRPGMGGDMGMRPGAGPGGAMAEQPDETKIASDEVIAKITADLKTFAALVQ